MFKSSRRKRCYASYSAVSSVLWMIFYLLVQIRLTKVWETCSNPWNEFLQNLELQLSYLYWVYLQVFPRISTVISLSLLHTMTVLYYNPKRIQWNDDEFPATRVLSVLISQDISVIPILCHYSVSHYSHYCNVPSACHNHSPSLNALLFQAH